MSITIRAYTWDGGHSAAVVLDGGGHIGQSLNRVYDHDDVSGNVSSMALRLLARVYEYCEGVEKDRGRS